MKKIILAVITALLPVFMFGQAQITTKKYKIEDFTEKILKVVMTGNNFTDQALKNEVKTRWRISPYEFCSGEEFEALKTNPKYYFLLQVKAQYKKTSGPSIGMITIVKGGPEAELGIRKMLEVVSFPMLALQDPSGREFVYLPAILDILQDHIIHSMEKDATAYGGLSRTTMNLGKIGGKKIVFANEDLSPEVTENVKKVYKKNKMEFADADEVDDLFINHEKNTVVSFAINPLESEYKSFSYKMLIDTETYQLYYFRRHKINKKLKPGFLIEDINRIATR